MKKKSIVLFLKASSGELHVALPILFLFKKKNPNVNIFFASTQKNILEKLRISETLIDTISEIGSCYFGKNKLIILLKEVLFNSSDTLILTCDSGAGEYEKIFYSLKLNSSLCIYHHAYALHSYDEEIINECRVKIKYKKKKSRYPSGSYALINSEFEFQWYNKVLGFDKSKIYVIGALGYSSKWLKQLGINSDNNIDNVNKIFIPIRHAHKIYLTTQNYRYQLEAIFSVAEKFPDIEFVIKPHPRQSDIIEILRRANKHKNLKVSYESTLILSYKSDLTISFWSSAILDSIAVGTPAVEFHKHETYHPRLIYEGNNLRSIYADLELAIPISTKEDIIDLIKELDQNKLNYIYQKQRTKFLEVFNINNAKSDDVSSLGDIFIETNKFNYIKILYKVIVVPKVLFQLIAGELKKIIIKACKIIKLYLISGRTGS